MLALPPLSPLLALGGARSLADLGSVLAKLPARLLLPGHCLTVASWYSDASLASNFMASYWVRREMGGGKREREKRASSIPSPSHHFFSIPSP